MGGVSMIKFVFEEIYYGYNFPSFTLYYNLDLKKFEIWYMGVASIVRITTGGLLLYWAKTEYMKLKYFVILFVLLFSLIAVDIVYLVLEYNMLHKPVPTTLFAQILNFSITFIFVSLLQILLLLFHLLKITGNNSILYIYIYINIDITKEFNHYATFQPYFYHSWIRPVYFSLFVIY